MKRSSWKGTACAAAVITASLLTAGCGGGSAKSSSSQSASTSAQTQAGANAQTVGGKVVIDNESGSTWTCQFNPFNASLLGPGITFGLVYEPLEFVNILQSTKPPKPMLATSSKWSDDYHTLTFTIRSGVKWTDGTPFSAKDVLYTFDAIKDDKAIDLNALWKNVGGPLTAVKAKGADQVVFTFSSPAQTYFYYVADQTPIVPAHIWSKLDQAKLASYGDTAPVGTGPFKVSSCSPQNISYSRNPDYWQSTSGHPVPRISAIDYPAFLSNTPANLELAQGEAQWGGQYIPDVKTYYVDKNPMHRHIWYAPVLNVALVPNLENPLLKQLAVRQAITYALDRPQIAKLGEGGEQQPANQSGVITPTFQAWVDSSISQPGYDPAKAQQILTAAGFKKGSDGIFHSPSGQPLSFVVKTISGYSDWDASLQVISQELKAVGISITVQDENSTPYTTAIQSGNFQLAYAGSGGPAAAPGPSPYYELRGWLFSGNIGSTNYSRFKSAAADALFRQYAGASHAGQVAVVHKLQQIMVSQLPFFPTTEGVDWFQYDTTNVGGWPTQSDPYAQASPYAFPDDGQVAAHLYPTK